MKYLIVLTGPTAVGKTDLSIELAQRYNTEIVSSDSRQIFHEMRIGTAVPDQESLDRVKHHFIQTISVADNYNASQFETDVLARLDQLFESRDVVVMTGGSMMYIDAVCKGIDIMPDIDPELRQSLKERYASEGIDNIMGELKILDPEYFKGLDLNNHKRVIHGLEVCLMTGKPYTYYRTGKVKERPFTIVKVCLDRDRTELYDRINRRVELMVKEGLVQESKELLNHRDLPALNTVGYKEIFAHLDGECTLDYAVERIQANTRKYARKQLTWFRRDGGYKWFSPDNQDEIYSYLDAVIGR